MGPQERHLALPAFIKVLTSNNLSLPQAMEVSSKIYKQYNTTSQLSRLTNVRLKVHGVQHKDTRKLVLAAIRKAGYTSRPSSNAKLKNQSDHFRGSYEQLIPDLRKPGIANTAQVLTTPTTKKRKWDDGLNDFLPEGTPDLEAATYGCLDFNEVLDEAALKTKYTVVNRAPLMTAWATVVAESIGFQREEALSIEMNAVSKGTLGLHDETEKNETKTIMNSAQPYVDLLGRRLLYQTQTQTWRALTSTSSPALPSTAFSYISRAFRQTTPFVIGALRLLAKSFPPPELNNLGFSLYAEFRPDVDGWGKRGEVCCKRILSLRKKGGCTIAEANAEGDVVKPEDTENVWAKRAGGTKFNILDEPEHKKARLEEYEIEFDLDTGS